MITKFASSNSHFKNQKFIFFVEENPTATAAENPTDAKMTVQDLIDGITKEIGLFDPKLLETILDSSQTRTADVLKNAKKGKKGTGIRLQTDYALTETEKENLRSYPNLHEKVIATKREREQNATAAETKSKTTEINTEITRENVESYTVQKGDTLSKIAKQYHTTARAIYDYNIAQEPEKWSGRNINSLKINETIFVPKPGTHLISTVLEEEKKAGVEGILDQPHEQITGMKDAATAKDVSPEHRGRNLRLEDAITQSLLSSIDHTLSASTKFQDYAKEARRMALSENNIEEHGWLRFKHDSGLLGIFTNGNEDDVIKQQQEYWLTNQDTVSTKKGAGWETGRLLRNTVIASAAATAVDNLFQLATYGAIPEAIPVTILSKLGEIDLGIRGRKSVQFSENDPGFQFMAQFSAAYNYLKSVEPEMENVLNDLQKNENDAEAQAKLKKLLEKQDVKDALQNFNYLANYASYDRLTNLQKGIENASTRREQNIPDSMDLARFMEPADRRSYLEFIRTLQNLKKDPEKNKDQINKTYDDLETFLNAIAAKNTEELKNYHEYGKTNSEPSTSNEKIYRFDRRLIAEHLFRSTEQGQQLLKNLQEGYVELGGRTDLNENDKIILEAMKSNADGIKDQAEYKQAEFAKVREENERRKEKEEGHLDQKLGSRASLVLFGLTESSRYAWGTLGRKKGIDDAIGEGKKRYEKYDFSAETIAEGKNETFNREKTKWLRDHGSVQGAISGTLNDVGEHIDYKSIENWKKGNQEWEKGESTPIKNILKLLEKIWGDDAIKSMIAIYNGTAKDRMVNADHAPFVNAAVDTLFPILRDMGISDLMKPLTQKQIQIFELKKTDIDQAVFHLLDQRIFENMDKGGKKRHEYEVFAALEKEYATLNEIAAKGKETEEYTKALENFMRALEATLENKLTPQQRELLNTIAENAAYINQVNATVDGLNIENIATDMTVHPDTPEHLERLRKLGNEGKELHEKFLHEFVVQKAFNADTSPEIIAAELEKYNQQFKSLRHQIENEGTMVDNLQQDKETIKIARDELVSKRVEKSYTDLNLAENVDPKNLEASQALIYYTYHANQLIRQKATEGRYIPVGPEIFKQGDDSIDKQVAKAKDFYELLQIADLSDWKNFKTSIGEEIAAILEEHHTDATTGKFGMMAPDEEIMGHYGLNINMLQLLLPAEKIPGKTERPPIIETWQKTFSMIGLEVSNSEILTALSQGTDLSPQEVKAKYGNTQNTGVYYFPEKGDKNAEFLPKEGEFAYEITFHRYIYTPTENITVTYNILLRDKCFNVNIPNLGLIQKKIKQNTPPETPIPPTETPVPQFEPTSFAGHAQIPSTLLVGWRFEIPRGGEIPGNPNFPEQSPPRWNPGNFQPPVAGKPNEENPTPK